MAEKEKPRWVEMTNQTFVSDEVKGSTTERRFTEAERHHTLVFERLGEDSSFVAVRLWKPNNNLLWQRIFDRKDLKKELKNRRLPNLSQSKKIANSIVA